MSDFDFIKDSLLRKNIEDSIEYIYLLHQESKEKGKNILYKEETNRVIILYVISVIEALFLYFYKNISEKDVNIDYKVLQELPKDIISKKEKGKIVLALKQENEKKEYELMLHTLVNFFEKVGRIKSSTKTRILELNQLRNTFHLSKKRKNKCNTKAVEDALDLLVYVIKNISKILK